MTMTHVSNLDDDARLHRCVCSLRLVARVVVLYVPSRRLCSIKVVEDVCIGF
jgi:hypothetical protein